MDIWIGTSGYSYADWVSTFYPAGTRPGGMLGYYSGFFPLVELNFTYYRPPTPAMLARIADKTPAGFQFLVKVPGTISHEGKADDLPAFRESALELKGRGQLKGVLCQFPQSTHCTRQSVDWLLTVARALDGLGLAAEFRHHSWDRPGLPGWLADNGVGLVAVDVPDLPGLFPRRLVHAGPTVYVRLHSRNAGKWYAGDKERYDYLYSDEELGEWVEALRSADGPREALVLFNNCHRSQAVVNARRMQEMFAGDDAFHPVPPFGPSPAAQPSLFA